MVVRSDMARAGGLRARRISAGPSTGVARGRRMKHWLLLAAFCSAPAFALTPCSNDARDYERRIVDAADEAVPVPWHLDIEVFSTVVPEKVARVADGRLYVIQFRSPLWRDGTAAPSALPKKGVVISLADVPRELTARLVAVVSKAVKKPGEREREGMLDGDTFRFDVPSVGCAQTQAPLPTSPDGRLAEVFDLIWKRTHASGAREVREAQQALVDWLDAMELAYSR